MTLTRLSEIIHERLGWCPNRIIAPHFRTLPTHNSMLSLLPGDRGNIMQDVIMDYGSTGMSIPLFTIILGGTIAGLFAIVRFGLFETWSSLGILMLSIFILGVAVRMAYQDIRKATIEFTTDAIAIWRPLSKPVILAKDAITTIEVRTNVNHSNRWLFRAAMVIFFAGIIPSILFSGNSLLIPRISFTVFMTYYLAVIVFFGLLFYHSYIRSHNSQILAIYTNDKKIVGLYVDDPSKMSDMLSKWRAGAV